jgi:FtsZ-interacting cell division protein ZipA
MPSNRRFKAFFLVVALFVLLTLYITASARQTRSSQFYTKTQDALTAARAAKEAKLHDAEVALGEDDMVTHRLKAAEEEAKRNADKKGDEFHGEEAKQKAIKVKESLEKNDEEAEDGKGGTSSKSTKASKEKSSGSGRKDPEEGEKSVAGRKIMKDAKEAVLKVDVEKKVGEGEEENLDEEETEDEQKAHAELNDILKKSPSKFHSDSSSVHR